MKGKKQQSKLKQSSLAVNNHDSLYGDPLEAARHIDSLMHAIQSRYGIVNNRSTNLGNFLITRAEVVFSDHILFVTLEKRAESQILSILTPQIEESKKEERRIELLNAFGDLILKFQKQAYLQIRDMLLHVLDDYGKRIFLEDFSNYMIEIEKKCQIRK